MEQKRLLLATSLSILVCGVWYLFVVPRFFPEKARPAKNAEARQDQKPVKKLDPVASDDDEDAEDAAEREPAQVVAAPAEDGNGEAAADQPKENGDAAPPAKKKPALPKHPNRIVELGSPDPAVGFRQVVHLNSQGAAVNGIEMVDPRLISTVPPHEKLMVLGANEVRPRSLELAVPQLRAKLRKLDWEVVELEPAQAPHSSVTFQLEADGLRVRKKYTLEKVDPKAERPEAAAYGLNVELEFRNLGSEERVVNYVLQGPTGLVLENEDNTSKFRDVVAGFLTGPDIVNHQLLSGAKIAEGKTEEWKKPVKYIGLDAQYFAALVCPQGNQIDHPYLESMRQTLIGQKNATNASASEISVELTSVPLALAEAGDKDGADRITHEYVLFAGPKRDEVLPPLAGGIIDFGNFMWMGGLTSWVARRLMQLLVLFQSLTGNWGVAIVMLTVVVRGVMVPISIKQAQNAAKMQEIGPKTAALKERYKDDPTKQMQEMHKLYRQHNVKPFQMGCLPALLQLPIFMGLYQSLTHAVDLRMAPFLYFDNLAAPDALFALPFTIPLLGWKTVNLLPVVSLSLQLLQQKLFAPPPANEEQAMQMKMMNFMMVAMLWVFYKLPAGLCVYFIVSSAWGITEKLLLPKKKPVGAGSAADPIVIPADPPVRRPSGKEEPAEEVAGGLWATLLKAAQKPDPATRNPNQKKRR